MKKWLKVLCALLVVLMLLPTLVACGGEDDPAETKPSGEIESGGGDTIDISGLTDVLKNNYNKTLGVLYLEDMFQRDYFFADKASGDGMEMVLWKRQNNVKDHLGISFNFIVAEGDATHAPFQMYSDDFRSHIDNRDGKYSLCLSHAYIGVPELITNNYLVDFTTLEGVDLARDHWNSNIMDQLAYRGGQYLGYSDFNLARTYVVAFNKRIYRDGLAALGGADDEAYIYNLVKNNEWTFELMFEMAEKLYEDNGSDELDTFGITGECWVPFINFYHSNGVTITNKSDKYNDNELSTGYVLSFEGNSKKENQTLLRKVKGIDEKLRKVDKALYSHFWAVNAEIGAATGYTTYQVKLTSNRAFMELMGTNELIGLTKVQGLVFGVLPYPMYDSAQAETVGYQSLNWAGYILVPIGLSNQRMVGEAIEVLSALSGDVVDYYYNSLLGLKASDTSLDRDMLHYVWDGLCSDFGVTFSLAFGEAIEAQFNGIVYAFPQAIVFNSSAETFITSASKNVNNKLIGKVDN